MSTFTFQIKKKVIPTIIWAFDCEKGDPSPLVAPIAMGVSVLQVENDEEGLVRVTKCFCNTFACFDGDTSRFWHKTLEFWNQHKEILKSFVSEMTPAQAFSGVEHSYMWALHLANTKGYNFAPVTDCAAFDWTVLAVQSAQHAPEYRRPLPMFAHDEQMSMQEPLDVSQLVSGHLMSMSVGFNPFTDSTKAAFDKLYPELKCPDWIKGNTHEPSEDATYIAWRLVQLLVVSN